MEEYELYCDWGCDGTSWLEGGNEFRATLPPVGAERPARGDTQRDIDVNRIGQAIKDVTGSYEAAQGSKDLADSIINNADTLRSRLKDLPAHKRYKVLEAVHEVERKRIVGD